MPQRRFFWTIYLTKYPDEANEILDEHRKLRNPRSNLEDDVIMAPEFYQALKEFSNKPSKQVNFREARKGRVFAERGEIAGVQVQKTLHQEERFTGLGQSEEKQGVDGVHC